MKKLLSLAIMALSLVAFTGSAFAQTEALTPALQRQVDNAIAQNDTATLATLAANNPTVAVTIAQRVVNAAKAAVTTHPAEAASLAAAATAIVTTRTLTGAAEMSSEVAKALGDIALTATAVAANPAVKAVMATNTSVATAVSTVTTNATTLVQVDEIAAMTPNLKSTVMANIKTAQSGGGGGSGSTVVGGNQNNGNTQQINTDARNQSPSS